MCDYAASAFSGSRFVGNSQLTGAGGLAHLLPSGRTRGIGSKAVLAPREKMTSTLVVEH